MLNKIKRFICLDVHVQTIAQTDIKLMPPRNVNHPISFDAKRWLSVQLHTPDWLSKTDVPSHALTGDRDKSIFAWMKSGATLALHKFCFIKQSMKSTKKSALSYDKWKTKALAGLKGANLLKDTSFASVWGCFFFISQATPEDL